MSIQIRQLSHTYMPGSPFQSVALHGVNLEIADGAFIGLIGHTGSGKSTLIQHLNALLEPTEGTVIVYGQNVFSKETDRRKIRSMVGLVFQYPEYQLFEETVYKDIAFGPKNLGMKEADIDHSVRLAMDAVGLSFAKYAERSPFDLSGGQRRRAAIAGVIAMQPRTLILDEPTAGLDPRGRREMLRMIKELHEQQDNTIIMVSHNMDDIARYDDRIVVMNHGTIAMQGTPSEVFAHAQTLIDLGLDVPETTHLIMELNARGWDIPLELFTIDEVANYIAGRMLCGE